MAFIEVKKTSCNQKVFKSKASKVPDAAPWKATHGTWPNDTAQVFVQKGGQLKMRINGGAQMTTFYSSIIISPLAALNERWLGTR